ncbi:MAG: hypothetical protein AAF675_14650 [Pseudomonadota bacterium]
MRVPGGRVTRILWLLSIPTSATVRFRAEAVGGGPVGGDVIVRSGRLLTGKERHLRLEAVNTVEKGARESDFSIYLRPDRDCEVTLEGRYPTVEAIFTVLGALIILGATLATVIPLFTG